MKFAQEIATGIRTQKSRERKNVHRGNTEKIWTSDSVSPSQVKSMMIIGSRLESLFSGYY